MGEIDKAKAIIIAYTIIMVAHGLFTSITAIITYSNIKKLQSDLSYTIDNFK